MSNIKKKLFTVNGIDIYENSIYVLKGKPDSSAPIGLEETGNTKIPFIGNANDVPCRFVIDPHSQDKSKGKFDTGFYPQSPCYRNKPKSKVAATVAELQKNVVKPYEEVNGEGILNHLNFEFWDDYLVKLELERRFNTANISDVLRLYIAINNYDIADYEKFASAKYRNAQFRLVDVTLEKTRGVEISEQKFNAISEFTLLQIKEPIYLRELLAYADILLLEEDVTEATLKHVFDSYLNEKHENVTKFLRFLEQGKEYKKLYKVGIPTMWAMLKKLQLENKITYVDHKFWYGEVNLGNNLRNSAITILQEGNTKLITAIQNAATNKSKEPKE